MERVSDQPGNTPLKDVPADYCPPGSGRWFLLENGLDDGKKMFFYDAVFGDGEPSATIVIVHGNPENSYAYRNVLAELRRKATFPFRVVAMDHIGFGLSDQATYEMEAMDHAENLLQLVRYLDLRDVTLVVHDWGGPAGIGAFIKEPERVSNLVILNTTVFPIPLSGLTFKNYPISWLGWCNIPLITPVFMWKLVGSYAAFRTPVGALRLLAGLFFHAAATAFGHIPGREKEAKRVYMEQFRPRMNAMSSRRMCRQTRAWAHGNVYRERRLGKRDNTPFYRFIQENIAKCWGPQGRNIGVRAVLGGWDPLAKEEVVRQWETHLPQLAGKVKIFEGVSHFVEEERPEAVADAIREVAGL